MKTKLGEMKERSEQLAEVKATNQEQENKVDYLEIENRETNMRFWEILKNQQHGIKVLMKKIRHSKQKLQICKEAEEYYLDK